MDAQSQTLLRFLYEWRKPLLLAPVIAGIVAAIASTPIFIQPLYESIVTVFPATTNSPSKALLPQNSYQDEDFLEFGAEEQAEQLIQILNSDAILTPLWSGLTSSVTTISIRHPKPCARIYGRNTRIKLAFSEPNSCPSKFGFLIQIPNSRPI